MSPATAVASNGTARTADAAKTGGFLDRLPYDALPDPTRAFSFLVMAIMFLRFLQGHEWDVAALVKGFVLNPFVVAFFTASLLVVYRGLQQKRKSLSHWSLRDTWNATPVCDRWAAEWYWWNAWLYHGVMDGAAGTLQAVPVVVSQYHILDLRFVNGHSVPWTIGLVELLVMQPVCLVTVYAILTKAPYRYPMEAVAATLHMFGAVVFVAAEVYEGQFNIPALDPVGLPENLFGNAKLLDYYQFVYYWFGFWFCNLIWVWVPMIRLSRAVQECTRALRMAQTAEEGGTKAGDSATQKPKVY